MLKKALILLMTIAVTATTLQAQDRGAAALGELVASLGTTTRVLMIGAHPDDEDTQLIAYLARAKHIETAYLSLTRGDGGQNLIGNELGSSLGIIRTEELLAARKIDGGRQYFSRAFDFGFSKTLEEANQHWSRDSILEDAVAIVRAFRPQVIIAVFTGTPADGHGHHQFSGVIAREVFDAAADSVRFPPSAVGGLKPWAPSKFYRLRRGGGGSLTFNVGEYDPLIGKSYSEIATESRSQHRSQGQGALPQRGPRFSGVQLEVSRVSDPKATELTLFDGIDTSVARFRGLALPDSVRGALDSLAGALINVRSMLDLTKPSRVVPQIANYLRLVARASSGITCETLDAERSRRPACDAEMGDLAVSLATTKKRATDALLIAAGVAIDATTTRELIALHDTTTVTVAVFNQGGTPVTAQRASLLGDSTSAADFRTSPSDAERSPRARLLFRAMKLTSPWWLEKPLVHDMFVQPLHQMIVGEDRLHDSGVEVALAIGGVSLTITVAPIVYRYADAALGEVRRPIAVVPEISALLDHEVEYARANAPFDRTIRVHLESAATVDRDVEVSLRLPTGLRADSATRRVSLTANGDANLYFRVLGKLATGRDSIVATARSHGETFSLGFVPIEYSHINPRRIFRRSAMQVEVVDATYAATLKIGYIRGVGDNVMPMLGQLGLNVTELDPELLPRTNLSGFTTIVLGSRAYEANPDALIAATPLLHKFARDGGTIVAQYGHPDIAQPGLLPFPVTLSRTGARVTDENAPVRVVDQGSPLLSTPNKITNKDFDNWVQERTLYMPTQFDSRYKRVFSLNDPGESPNDAAVLVAPEGKGVYIFTTFSFFRQLPAGNPGAARLFVNLLSADHRAAERP